MSAVPNAGPHAVAGAPAPVGRVEPISILVCALGGEGGGVLTEWLVGTAERAGYVAQSTSIPGVAQRTGATTYYVEVFPVPVAQLNGRRPVLSLYPVPGALDAIVSSELLETVRQIGNGLASHERTRIITSSSRTLTTNERMQMGDGRMPGDALVDIVRRASLEHHILDMAGVTREAGTVVSAVMFGAVAASGLLPFTRAQCEAAIADGGRSAGASLAGFALAFERIEQMRRQTAYVARVVGGGTGGTDGLSAPEPVDAKTPPPPIPPAVSDRFPPVLQPILSLGHACLVEYQDAGYAALYLDRIERIVNAEATGDPERDHGSSIAAETARYLALWMAFDDIVRVAELKSRASRRARVQREIRSGPRDVVKIFDHFKPGIPEIAALLPDGLARTVTQWDARRRQRGKDPWAMPVKLGTHTVFGMLALRVLGGLEGMRRRGSRFAVEQALIGRWLAAIERGAALDWQLGHELALCGRLIKGYGSTNERGKENLLHIVDHLAVQDVDATTRAVRIRAARTAALADENGAALDRTLIASGAPPRAVKASTIRFHRKAPARQAS